MKLWRKPWYHLQVDLLGKGFLRVQRWRSEYAQRRTRRKFSEHLAPPLHISAWTKELIYRHYLKGRYAQGVMKVAWVTSGAPAELLRALGFFVYYPENHGAVCGTMRQCVPLATYAEEAGFARDLCAYARTDIGAVLSGKTPVGRLPKPDVLMACTNICQTVLFWYRVLAQHFRVPLILIDTPFVYGTIEDHAVEYVKQQLEEAVPIAERIAGVPLKWSRLQKVTRLSKSASELWLEILREARHIPAPISVFDQFIQMAPIVEMRGEAYTVDFYAALLKEVRQRVHNGVGVVKTERKRLLWDNLPIWFRLRWMAELLAERGAALIASTYTHAWGELAPLIDVERPLESAARVYLLPILNRSTGDKLRVMLDMVSQYQLHGVILHSDRSCKPYSLGQMDQRDRLIHEHGLPALLLEADHNDPRSFSEAQAINQLHSFLELLGV